MGTENEEIVITAFGCISPIGSDYSQIKKSLLEGISGVKEIKKFNCDNFIIKHAGIPDEGNNLIRWPSDSRISGTRLYTDLAVKNLKKHPAFPKNFYKEDQIGCIVGIDVPTVDLQSGFELAQFGDALGNKKEAVKKFIDVFKLRDCIDFDPSHVFSIINKEIPFKGLANCHLGLCSASSQAIGMGFNAIRSGIIDAAIVGGVSGKVIPLNLVRLELVGAISLDTKLDPDKRSRPFDKRRSGFVLSEGAIFFLIEKKSAVKKRGDEELLSILGYGSSLGAQHIVAPHTESLEMELCMRRAIKNADINPKEIDVINAHATSTVLNDLHESIAINKIFGEGENTPQVLANKSIHGHLIAAAGAMEVLNTIISVKENFLPGTLNLEEQDSNCKVNAVKRTKKNTKSHTILKNSFGMGGLATSLVLCR